MTPPPPVPVCVVHHPVRSMDGTTSRAGGCGEPETVRWGGGDASRCPCPSCVTCAPYLGVPLVAVALGPLVISISSRSLPLSSLRRVRLSLTRCLIAGHEGLDCGMTSIIAAATTTPPTGASRVRGKPSRGGSMHRRSTCSQSCGSGSSAVPQRGTVYVRGTVN